MRAGQLTDQFRRSGKPRGRKKGCCRERGEMGGGSEGRKERERERGRERERERRSGGRGRERGSLLTSQA